MKRIYALNGPNLKSDSVSRNSLMSRTATGIIIGFGASGYELALDAMRRLVQA